MNKNLYTLLLYVLLAVCGGAVGRDCHAAGGRAVGKYGDVLLRLHALSLDQLLARGDSPLRALCFRQCPAALHRGLGPIQRCPLPKPTKLNCAYASLNAGRIYFMQYDYMQAQSVFLRGLEMCNGLPDDRLNLPPAQRPGQHLRRLQRLPHCLRLLPPSLRPTPSPQGPTSLSYAPVLGKPARCLLQPCATPPNLARYHCRGPTVCLPPTPMIRVLGPAGTRRARPRTATTTPPPCACSSRHTPWPTRVGWHPNYLCSSLNNMAETYLLQRRYNRGPRACCARALRPGRAERTARSLQSIIYDELATVYDKRNDVAAFARYMRLHRQIADSIKNMQDYHNIKNIERQYEMARLNKYIDQLSTERVIRDERLRNQLLILCVVVAALVVAVVLLLMVYRQKQKLEVSYRGHLPPQPGDCGLRAAGQGRLPPLQERASGPRCRAAAAALGPPPRCACAVRRGTPGDAGRRTGPAEVPRQ